jgi:hypothetical protein
MLRSITSRTVAAGAVAIALAAGTPGDAAADRWPPPRDLRGADAIDSDLRSQARRQAEPRAFAWDDAAVGGVAVLGGVLMIGGGTAMVAIRRR